MSEHFFTVDVEEYFQVGALEPFVARDSWTQRESRVQASVDLLLELLAERGAKGTFFILGVVADRTPEVVKRIASGGHEVASHGWSHQRVVALRPNELRDELIRSRQILEDLSGQRVIGYRAPNFSILPGWEWAYDLLIETGYLYDSSVFPARQSGQAQGHEGPFVIQRSGGELLEVPMTAAQLGPVRVPAAGGAWFRLLPYALTRRALDQADSLDRAGVFYIHPWEVDPGQPVVAVDALTRLRHYGGLAGTAQRIRQLLADYSFTSIAEGLRLEPAAAGVAV